MVLRDFLHDGVGAPLRPVAADGEQHVDVHAFQRLDDFLHRLLPAGGPQDRAALRVDVVDKVRIQVNRLHGAVRDKPLVAVADAVDVVDAIYII